METSEKQSKAIELGKLIVAQIQKEPQRDVLSGWMACYISELLQEAETAKGDEKDKLQARCFSTILELWEHLRYLPSGHRPTRDFEAVIETLDAITPASRRYFYKLGSIGELTEKPDGDDITNELKFILSIDKLARNLIGHLLNEVCEKLSDRGHADLVALADELYPDPYTRLLSRLFQQMDEFSDTNGRSEALISDMGKLLELAEAYRKELKKQIDPDG